MNNGIPLVPLGELLTKSENWVDISPDQRYRQVTVRLWGKGVSLRGEVSGAEIAASRQLMVKPLQFILSRIDARNGAFGLIPDELDSAIVSSDFPVFSLNHSRVLPTFLDWMSKTSEFMHLCKAASEGTTNRVRLKEDRFLAAEIPLPPLEEQQRVVAHIGELAARVEKARGLRREAVEEVEVLLAAILKDKRESMLHGNYPKAKIGDVSKVSAGGTPSRDAATYWGGNIPWIKTGELLDGDIYRAEEYISQDGLNNSSAKLFPPETILIALYGQGQTRGRTGRLMITAATNQACCAILPSPSHLEPRFTQYWLRSLYLEMRERSHGGAQPNWNGQMIKNIEIALPPLSEQRRIVAYLDDLQARVDALKQLQAETQAELDSLLPSILDKAFKGELV
jgi:type I restriction enzyme, S subunit